MVKNLPSNARDMGLIPGGGTKIPQLLSKPLPSGAHAPQLEKPQVPLTREKVHVTQQRPSTVKVLKIKNFN